MLERRIIIPKHLHEISFISERWLRDFFSELENAKKYPGYPDFSGTIAASIYLEPSISTEMSFNIALMKMNIKNLQYRSMNIEDYYTNPKNMILRFGLLGVNIIFLRSNDLSLYTTLKTINLPTINCGCDKLGNPTETLQDLYTIWKRYKRFDKIKVLVIGDVSNSSTLNNTLKLFSFLNIQVIKININDFVSLKYFFYEVQKNSENSNVIYLLRDDNDKFINHNTNNVGYSSLNWKIFKKLFQNIKDKNILFLNGGSKRLHDWFNKPLYKELFYSEKERYSDGELVRISLIRKILETYDNC